MSIRPSTKSFPDLNEIRCVGRGCWVIHDGMPYDPNQGQGQVVNIRRLLVGVRSFRRRLSAWTRVFSDKLTSLRFVRKWRKWPISKSIFSTNMRVIKRPMVNYDNPRQYQNFNCTDFWYSSSFCVTWPSNLRRSFLANKFCLLRGVDQQSCTVLIYIMLSSVDA